jgi:spermidine synthase
MDSQTTVELSAQRSRKSVTITVFACLFCSGFSSLLYQVIWTRFAYAGFGVIAPVLSLTIATFMLGFGAGTLLGGRLAARATLPLPYLYASVELIAAVGALSVPALLRAGATSLQSVGTATSTHYLALSALVIVAALLPWCIAMGATIPLMLGVMRRTDAVGAQRFAYLYIANVAGAVCGAAGSALVLVELFGLHGTCAIGALGNLISAGLALTLPHTPRAPGLGTRTAPNPTPPWVATALFITSFSSVGMELCWARGFTMVLQTSIYAFAAILATYLLATLVGSTLARASAQAGRPIMFERAGVWLLPLALLPAFAADPRSGFSAAITLASIVPFCGLLGAVTPGLIDRIAGGDPAHAARLYTINIAGGTLGPLLAGYILLPQLSIRISLIILALPLLLAAWLPPAAPRRLIAAASLAMLAATSLFAHSYDEAAIYPAPVVVHRDYAGTAVAFGTGFGRQLVVNGIYITNLVTVTKVMADLPMAYAAHHDRALDICFGMGTTFHTLTLWPARVTAVDLSSAVLASFGFFHDDASFVLQAPDHRLIADDGRRYLARTGQMFDVITIDPPPPIEAAASSLLYSEQFYALAKRHLAAGGVLAQWVPDEGSATDGAIALALHAQFAYILVFRGADGFGLHFLASMTPLPALDTAAFIARLPPAARTDLIAWAPGTTIEAFVGTMLGRQIPLATLLPASGSGIVAITDDRPFNEYFLLRRFGLIGTLH